MKQLNSIVLTLALFSSAANAIEYYVNPNGNDSWSGKLRQTNASGSDGPFKTLERAKTEVLSLKQKDSFTDKVNINIASGTYYLKQTLSFTLADSGVQGKEIVWRGEPGSKVILSGGIPISCSKKIGLLWECPLNQTPLATGVSGNFFSASRITGSAPKFELYVNSQKFELARWPDQGWAHIKTAMTPNTQFSVMQSLPVFNGDIRSAQVHIFPNNDWYDQIIGITSLSNISNSINLSTPTSYNLDTGRRFFIQNIQSALDAPGEWFYDNVNKKIQLILPSGTLADNVVVSSLPNLITTNGTKLLTFQNMTLKDSSAVAVKLGKSDNVVLDNLNIHNSPIGLIISGGTNVKLINSEIHHIGTIALEVLGGDRSLLKPSGHIINNNHVHHFGTTLFSIQGIAASGVGIQLTHNLIEEGSGTGINLAGNDNLVEKNEFYHLCLQAADCGAFYSGKDWSFQGNIVRNNYVHDILGYGLNKIDLATNTATYSSPNNATGIYLDDAVSGFEVYGNILENAGQMSIQLGGGRNNKIHDNFIKTNQYAIWMDNRWPSFDWTILQRNLNAVPYKSSLWSDVYPELALDMHNYKWPEGNRIEKNIIVSTQNTTPTFLYKLPVDSTVIADNLIWNDAGPEIKVQYLILESGKTGISTWTNWLAEHIETGSLYANPCASISNKKLEFCASSAATKMGFASIPTDIGMLP